MKKRRADSTLFSLPEATQRAIYRLEEEAHLTLVQIQHILDAPESEIAIKEQTDVDGDVTRDAIPGMGVGYVSVSSLSNFLKEWRTTAWRESLHAAAATSESVKDTLSDADRANIDDSINDGLREWILDSIVKREIDAGDVKSLLGLIQKSKAQELDERKITLLEKKAAFVDEMKDKADNREGGLTPEDMEEIERKLKLL
ncbi:hypothetical protein ACWPKS_15900 [Coraliomargarita sp. W4R72]